MACAFLLCFLIMAVFVLPLNAVATSQPGGGFICNSCKCTPANWTMDCYNLPDSSLRDFPNYQSMSIDVVNVFVTHSDFTNIENILQFPFLSFIYIRNAHQFCQQLGEIQHKFKQKIKLDHDCENGLPSHVLRPPALSTSESIISPKPVASGGSPFSFSASVSFSSSAPSFSPSATSSTLKADPVALASLSQTFPFRPAEIIQISLLCAVIALLIIVLVKLCLTTSEQLHMQRAEPSPSVSGPIPIAFPNTEPISACVQGQVRTRSQGSQSLT